MISPANTHEGAKLIPLMGLVSIEVRRRQRKRPKTIYADSKYAAPLNRIYLDGKRIRSQISDPPNKMKRPRRLGLFDRETYHEVR